VGNSETLTDIPMAEVILENVYKIYPGEVTAANDVSISIKDKEFVVLVGPSGCGKSTTLRMIAGLEEISKGTISIDGRIVNDVAPKDRDIAMVFQNYALYPHMSVRENMAFGLKLRKFPKEEINKRVEEAAEILELSQLLERKPKALSGGQRQRVALGRAIVRKPKVFLFDEPLSNLDAKLRNQMRAEILRLHHNLEATIVYVTHDQVEAMTMGSRIVVMKDGLVQQVDSPIDLYNKPVNQFVAGFIGSPTMNFVDGDIKEGIFSSELLKYNLSASQKEKVQDGKYVLGIRPEDLLLETDNGNYGSLTGKVEISEPLGAETFLHVMLDKTKIIARVQPELVFNVGDDVNFYFNPDQTHLFSLESGEVVA